MKITSWKSRIYFAGVAMILINFSVSNFAQSDNSKIEAIISKMTLEEKAALVVGKGMRFNFPGQDQNSASNGPVIGETQILVPGAAGFGSWPG